MAESEYTGQCNYAYHLDAGAFAEVLMKHCKSRLGVRQIIDTVLETKLADNGDVDAIVLKEQGELRGDLFVDCTGFASLLLGKTLGVPFVDASDVLFNNRALTMQVPYERDDAPLATHTIASAQNAGWIWDIGLCGTAGSNRNHAGRDFIKQWLQKTGA